MIFFFAEINTCAWFNITDVSMISDMNFLPRGELRTIVVTSEVQHLGPVSFKALIDIPPKWASEEESVFKKIAPYKFWKHFQGVLIFTGSFQPFSEDIFHGSFNSLRRRQEFRKVQNSALESRWTDLFQILWNINDLQEILMLKMFFCHKKGLLLKCSQWVTIWFDWCVFAGQNILMTCALRLRSSIQKTTTQLSEIGCVKSWWIEKKLGDARGGFGCSWGCYRDEKYETKTFQIHSNWWCFCFWRAVDDEECLAFQEHKKKQDSAILWQESVEIEGSSNYRNNLLLSNWTCRLADEFALTRKFNCELFPLNRFRRQGKLASISPVRRGQVG